MSEDTAQADAAAEFAKFVEKFLAEVPAGPEGDAEMRRRVPHTAVDVTTADIRPDELSDEQLYSWFDYMAWNLWEVIAKRSSEGESGLIPRQEYETMTFVQQRALYPDAVRLITEKIGVDGLVEAGRQPHAEVGSKLNHLRNWACSVMVNLGRGVTTTIGLETPQEGRRDINDLVQFSRRLWLGTWGEGPGVASGNGFTLPLLNQEFLHSLTANADKLDDPARRATFRRFNATTELFGFMLHYDNRLGMGDTGPYTLPDGRIALVRDHFLAEDSYHWAEGLIEEMPYAVVEVMIFAPDKVKFTINDIGTTFTDPSSYLEHLDAVAVYARDTIDTPMSQLRKLDDAELQRLSKLAEVGTLELYKRLAKLDRDQKIINGVHAYTQEFIRPIAQYAGVWDDVRALGFDALTQSALSPLAQRAWPTLTGGEAAAILGPVFLLGKGFPRFDRSA